MTAETTASFKQIFSVRDITTLLLGEFAFETVLPEVRRNRLDLLLTILIAHRRHAVVYGLGETPEGRHLGTGTKTLRTREPYGHPFLAKLQTHVLKIRSDLLLVLHQILRLQIQLIDPGRQDAVGDL